MKRKKLKIKVSKMDLKNFKIDSDKMELDDFWKDLYDPKLKHNNYKESDQKSLIF